MADDRPSRWLIATDTVVSAVRSAGRTDPCWTRLVDNGRAASCTYVARNGSPIRFWLYYPSSPDIPLNSIGSFPS
jgi:hypothetical protein